MLGLAVLTAAAFFLFLGLGPVAGLVWGNILVYLSCFIGGSLLVAVLLDRIFDKKDSQEENHPWF